MKRSTKFLTLLAIICLFGITKSKAQSISVSIRPTIPSIYVNEESHRPPPPSARHIWVSGEWVVVGGVYTYQHGYWALPPRAGATWIKGHWAKRPNRPGWFWSPGRWFYN